MDVAINEQCHRVRTMPLGAAYHVEQIQEVLVLTCTGLIHAKWLPKEFLSTSLPRNVDGDPDGSPDLGALHTTVHTFNISKFPCVVQQLPWPRCQPGVLGLADSGDQEKGGGQL